MNKDFEGENKFAFIPAYIPKWKVSLTPSTFVCIPNDVSWFRRMMWTLLLGVKWERIGK